MPPSGGPALAQVPEPVSLIVAGTGTQAARFEALAESLGLGSRVQFLGEVDDDDLVALYAGALAVVYPPFDEDFGYVTLEAFLSKKPVVTTADAGEPATFVLDGINGRVTEPDASALADAITDLATHRARAAAYGATGYDWARQITWDHAIDRLVDGL